MSRLETSDLVEMSKQGDSESLGALCMRFYPDVLKYMRYRVDAASAEDLTSEVFLRVLRHIGSQKGSFVAWLYRIASNIVIDNARRGKVRRESPLDEEGVTIAADGEGPADVVARQMDVQSAIARLTDEQHELVVLKFIQGLSNLEISRITGRSMEAIRGLQFRALSALRRFLDSKE